MSNTKNRPYICLVAGIDNLSLLTYAVQHMGDEVQWPVELEYNETPYVLFDISDDLPKGVTVDDILSQLDDHIMNTNMEDWLTPMGDYHIPGGKWVDVYEGDYYAQGITIHFTRLSFSE